MKSGVFYAGVLILLGAGWGATQPLSKIAVSTGHQHFGLILWQLVFSIIVLGAIALAQGKRLPLGRDYLWRYALIALVGTVLPNSVSYQAAVHLPAGILSIIISLVPMFALPMALAIGMERFRAMRALGILCGAVAIVLLAGPSTSLPAPGLALWVLIAALSPLLYAVEGTWVARYGILDLDALQLLLGASIVGLLITLPLTLLTGQYIDITQSWGAPEYSLFASSVIHAFVYTAYVWLVGRAGSVFASQVSYLVTGFGVLWAILFLGESYSAYVWSAMAVMMLGLFLVRPREALE